MKGGRSSHWRAPAEIQARARTLRRNLTDPERRLWRRLRSGQLDGARFRRQHAVGRYIVDFFCARTRLVVEIDGDSHAGAEAYDLERTRWLEGRGYTILRFTNREVVNEIEAVIERIAEFLSEPPP